MSARVAYCVDIDKSVIIGNFEKRGWVSVGPDDDWHFYWASTTTCRNLFAVDSGKIIFLWLVPMGRTHVHLPPEFFRFNGLKS